MSERTHIRYVETNEDNGETDVVVQCPTCSTKSHFIMMTDEFDRFTEGGDLSELFPEWGPRDYRGLIDGTCWRCFDKEEREK